MVDRRVANEDCLNCTCPNDQLCSGTEPRVDPPMMHVTIEHMFLMLHRGHHYVHAGTRISCDDGRSWVVDCKRSEGLVFHKDEVSYLSTRRREITFEEYKRRMQRNLKYGMAFP